VGDPVTRTIAAWLLAAVLAIIVSASGYGGYRLASNRYEAKILADRLAAEQAARTASEKARAEEERRHRAQEKVDVQYQEEMERTRRVAAAARSELDRLRAVLAQRERAAAEHAETEGRPDDAAAERESLGDCAQEYQQVAEEADRLADQVRGLQGYVREVVRPEGMD